MSTATISVSVDNDIAQIFQSIPVEQREQLHGLIGYLVQQYTASTPEALFALMDDMAREAKANGLTEEHLDSILNDE